MNQNAKGMNVRTNVIASTASFFITTVTCDFLKEKYYCGLYLNSFHDSLNAYNVYFDQWQYSVFTVLFPPPMLCLEYVCT